MNTLNMINVTGMNVAPFVRMAYVLAGGHPDDFTDESLMNIAYATTDEPRSVLFHIRKIGERDINLAVAIDPADGKLWMPTAERSDEDLIRLVNAAGLNGIVAVNAQKARKLEAAQVAVQTLEAAPDGRIVFETPRDAADFPLIYQLHAAIDLVDGVREKRATMAGEPYLVVELVK